MKIFVDNKEIVGEFPLEALYQAIILDILL